MDKKIVLILLLLSVSLSICFSQKILTGNGSILFRGVILDATSQTSLPGSKILINRNKSVVGAADGTFSFYASKNDTVVFSMLGYKSSTLIISDTLAGSEFLTGVYLENDTLMIGEVVILPRFSTLKAEMMNPDVTNDSRIENARSNISVVSYQGRTGQTILGDPSINYEILRQRQRTTAYEKGGIPSEKILGLSPLMLIPAAYLLIRGLPEKPEPPKPKITSKDLQELRERFMNSQRNRKQESPSEAITQPPTPYKKLP